MSEPWLDVVGIGEDGVDGLAPPAKEALRRAAVVIGGDRHHDLAPDITAECRRWPSPFDAMIDEIRSLRGRRPALLVTGDPLWYSVGARILRSIPAAEVRFHPQLSAFQWAACRMGWSLADCTTLTVHGRPVEQIVPHVAPRARLLVLTQNRDTPASVAALLREGGFGASRMTALAALGGPREQRFDATADGWAHDVPHFHTLAIECVGTERLPLTGLPDDAFEHDGQITKRDVRATTLAKLAPFPDAVLWDVGLGCGSVSVEWMRAARGAQAFGIEPKRERRAMAERNARRLGVARLKIVEGHAPDALDGLPQPDAAFIGGGLSDAVFDRCREALPPGGRLVANVVTLESEGLLLDLHARHGGELARIAVAHAGAVGPYRGWRSAMPVTQWSWTK